MDRNTIIGFILIFVILFGFTYLNRPTPEQQAAQQRYQDSIAWVQQQRLEEEMNAIAAEKKEAIIIESEQLSDSAQQAKLYDVYGSFGVSAVGEEELVTLENELIKLQLSSKGGRIYSVHLKEYTTYVGEPLYLFDGNEESAFGITFITANNRIVNTSDFYFEVIRNSDLQTTLRLNAGENKSLDFIYTLHLDDYMVDFDMLANNLETELSPTMRTLDLHWMQKVRQQERGRTFEERYSRLTFKFLADDVEQLRESKDDVRNIPNKVKWIGYKNQFFSAVLIAPEYFESTKLDSRHIPEGKFLKEYNTFTSIPFTAMNSENLRFNFYFGPNDYTLLRSYDKNQFREQNLELEKLVPLGWSLFRIINKSIIIPVFDWLRSWSTSMGLIIFLLTLIIKTALFPLTYKSFMSSAKMRVLRPQIEEITKKYPGTENAMTRQQKTMEFYRQAGVNPMAGCLPQLLQMPFLISMFFFFPTAIALRQESFLWATDLSAYDNLIQWDAYIPFVSDYFGNHISLFCLLFAVVTALNTKFTMEQQGAGSEQMPGMKMMMYLMPVMMFFFLNSFPSGLNYYYLVSTLITVGQMLAFRLFLNEEQLLAKLEANKGKAKPKKKSGFMARLEEAQRQQQAMLREQQKKKNKR
jgi:YidC/Oxa1 family membrane protein insertase